MSLGEETVFIRESSEGKEELVMEWEVGSQKPGVYEGAEEMESEAESQEEMVFDDTGESADEYESGSDAAPTETHSYLASDEDDFASTPRKKKAKKKRKSISDIVSQVLDSDEEEEDEKETGSRKGRSVQSREEWERDVDRIEQYLLAQGQQNSSQGSRNSRSNFQKKVKRGGYTLVAGVLYRERVRSKKG